MISLHLENLKLFIPQYVASTIISVLIYIYLGQKSPGRENTIPLLKKTRYLGSSGFCTPKHYGGADILTSYSILPAIFAKNSLGFGPANMFFDLLSYFSENGFPKSMYRGYSAEYTKPPFYEKNITYQMYRIMFSISAWAGLMLAITPYLFIYVFIPHFSNPYNIITAIVLSISIFEGIISTIFFRLGVTLGKIVLVESLVMVAFTFSLISPSMSWISAFDLRGELIIYLILLFLFTAITGLISQLRTKRNLFISSMAFSIVSYFSFVAIVSYNVIRIIGI